MCLFFVVSARRGLNTLAGRERQVPYGRVSGANPLRASKAHAPVTGAAQVHAGGTPSLRVTLPPLHETDPLETVVALLEQMLGGWLDTDNSLKVRHQEGPGHPIPNPASDPTGFS